jgi:hypothetical protein
MVIELPAIKNKIYYLKQIFSSDDQYYLLSNMLGYPRDIPPNEITTKTKRVSLFQNLQPIDKYPQFVKAQTNDTLILEKINIGDKILIEAGEFFAEDDNIDKYVNVKEDLPYELDLETANDDRKRKLFKIIGLAESYDFGREEILEYNRLDYKNAYVCILNVKS